MREQTPLELLVRDGADEDIQRFFVLLRPPELADVVERLDEAGRLRVLGLMGAPLASDVIREVDESEVEEILEDLPVEEIADIVHEARSDDAADLIAALPDEKRAQTLDRLDKEERAEIEELLEYGEETAGGIMQTELVALPVEATVGEAIARIKLADEEEVGDIHVLYVVDRDQRLLGVVSPSDLLQAEVSAPITAVYERNPVSVPVTLDQEELAERVSEYDLPAIAVVDAENRLLGQVLVDDVMDVLKEEATEDIARMAGADPEEIYDDSVRTAIRLRAPWLAPAFVGGLLVVLLLGNFEQALKNATVLALFLPVVLGMAGNVGTQTSALTVRSIALGRIEMGRRKRLILRQMLTGISLGLIYGSVLVAFAWMQGNPWRVLVTLGVSISVAMTVGATMGVTVPLLLNRMGIDPAIATSPFVQTANDVTGAGILFLVAHATGLVG